MLGNQSLVSWSRWWPARQIAGRSGATYSAVLASSRRFSRSASARGNRLTQGAEIVDIIAGVRYDGEIIATN
jgi:hypothetical protein